MEKIVDVYGHNIEFGEIDSKENHWSGRLLVGADDCFEGIVEDYRRTTLYFVFGQLGENNIQLTKCTKEDIDIPYTYDATNNKGTYTGAFNARNSYTEIPLGEAKITLIPSEVTRDESEWEKKDLKTNIILMKHRLGEIGSDLHEKFEVSRVYASEKLLKKQQNI